jgi:hypothetical protein
MTGMSCRTVLQSFKKVHSIQARHAKVTDKDIVLGALNESEHLLATYRFTLEVKASRLTRHFFFSYS